MLSSLELWMNLVLDILCCPFIYANFNGSLSMVVFSHRRLAIQTDENDALKEALRSTLKAKEEDLKFYQEMMDPEVVDSNPVQVDLNLCFHALF